MEKDYLNPLQKIKQVEAPKRIFYQLEEKIEQFENNKVPVKWLIPSSLVVAILLFFNIYVLKSSFTTEQKVLADISTELHLNPSNQIYYE